MLNGGPKVANLIILSQYLESSYNRPVIGGGVVCTYWDIMSVNFLLSQDLYFTIGDGGAPESAAKLPELKIIILNLLVGFKKNVRSDLIVQLYNRNKSYRKWHF